MKTRALLITALMLLAPSLSLAEIAVEGAWVRMPPPVADTAAGYMTIRNSGNHDVEITGITCNVAKSPEFHSMSMHGDMMHMMKMEKVVVPAHGELHFESGGNHLMLQELTGELHAGDHVMMTLTTDGGDAVMVHAEVRDVRVQDAGSGHGGHHHSH